jgi:hypothetical protein
MFRQQAICTQQQRKYWKWHFVRSLCSSYIGRTKHDCAGKDQQQFTWPTGGQDITPTFMRQKCTVMSPAGPRIKNNCVDKGQQQFTQLTGVDSTVGVAAWLTDSWDGKTWSWVPRNLEPRMTVLARNSSNLPDRQTDINAGVGQLHNSQSHETEEYGHESKGLEPNMTVPSRASGNSPKLDCTTQSCEAGKYGHGSQGGQN